MADVFISYHEDSAGELAERIAAALDAGGVSCWCARREIGAGGDFAEAIPREIGRCRIFLLLISRGAVESPYVRNEIGLAFKRTGSRGGVIIIIVCHIRGGIWYGLRSSEGAGGVLQARNGPLPAEDDSPAQRELSGAGGGLVRPGRDGGRRVRQGGD